MRMDVYDYDDVSDLYSALKVECYKYCYHDRINVDETDDFKRGRIEGYNRVVDELLYLLGCNDNESRFNYVTDLYEWLHDNVNTLWKPESYYDLGQYDVINYMAHIVYYLYRSIL